MGKTNKISIGGEPLKITRLGVITALKNIGLFVGTYTFLGVQAEPLKFLWALLVYTLISVPSDLYLLNKAEGSE